MSLMSRVQQIGQGLRLRRRGIHRHMRIFSHTTIEERMTLHQIARGLPQGARVLEIGAHIGSSALLLGHALKDKNGRLYCCDTWNNETMPDGERDTWAVFQENTKEFSDIVTPLRKRSDDLTLADVGGLLDMVFIDGDHSEAAVRRDFELVRDWVKPTGMIVFHDVNKYHPGVIVVFGEALASGNWQAAGLVGCLGWIRRTEVIDK